MEPMVSFYIILGTVVLLIIALLLILKSKSKARKKKKAGSESGRDDGPAGFVAPDDLAPSPAMEDVYEAPAKPEPKAAAEAGPSAAPEKELEELLIWHPPAMALTVCPCCGAERPAHSPGFCEVCGREQ